MQLRSAILWGALSLILTSCGGGGGPGGSPGGDKVLRACDDVVTQDKVDNFNKKQSAFNISSGGASVNCRAEINENGKVTKVEVSGRSMIQLRPGLIYLRSENTNDPNSVYRIFMEKIIPTDEDARAVLKEMGIAPITGAAQNFEIQVDSHPSYVRFGKGALFYVIHDRTVVENKRPVLVFEVTAEDDQRTQLEQGMAKFTAGSFPLEVLWSPNGSRLAKQQAQDTVEWSQLTTLETLVSFVRDNFGTSNRVLVRAIDYVYYWNIDVPAAHRELPELYNFAMTQWKSPVIADNTYSDLVFQLRYVVGVNPSSELKPTLETYEILAKYQGSGTTSLKEAIDYVAGKLWTKPQFDLLLGLSQIMYDALGSSTWEASLEIAKRTGYDQVPSMFIARVGLELKKRGLVNRSGATELVNAAYAKVQAGLNDSNISLYFSTMDQFTNESRADKRDAEQTCDELVLSGKLTNANQGVYFSLVTWLKDTAYVNFSDSYPILISLSATQPLNSTLVELFKSTFSWLKDTVYLNRTDALGKAGRYAGNAGFSSSMLGQVKNYFAWLTGSIYLNKSDALLRTENAVVFGGLNEAQVTAIQSLTDWYIAEIYLNRKSALDRSEALVVEKKISPAQLDVMKNIISWLVSDLYINRSEAADKGESYVLAANPLTPDRAAILKSYTNWLISELYINRSDALAKGENFVLTLGFDTTQIDTMKSAVIWLTSDVHVSRSEALTKSELYLTKGKLTPALFSALKSEYETQINARKSRTEALKIAESKVLSL